MSTYAEYSVDIANESLALKDRNGNLVSFQGAEHFNVTSSFSDTVDLPNGPGYLYVGAACTLSIILLNSTTALPYAFPQAGFYPILVKRVRSTGSDTGVNVYIVR